MVLKMLAAASAYFPSEYTVHVVTTLIVVLATRRIAQGRSTTRERDMHARVVVVTGGFTPLGLTLLESLATRGAHIIALTPLSVSDPSVSTYIDLLRSTTANENIYAETCDLASPPSIHAFAKRFVLGAGAGASMGRIDALVCAHEYAGLGAFSLFSSRRKHDQEQQQRERDESALATFLLTTLLLPAMLTAPVERDIRIVNVVNRFYAAAAPRFFLREEYGFSSSLGAPASTTNKSQSPFLPEATRALRTALLTRHLQRVLDALPSAPVPDPTDTTTATQRSQQKSNIVTVSVSPGLSRAETVGPLFGEGWLGRICYLALYPFLFLLTKSAAATVQSVLHVLFLPTPVKISKTTKSPTDPLADPEEALKPGALYAECAVVRLVVPSPPAPAALSADDVPDKGKGKEKEKETETELPDDGELGGERGGRAVWEAYEAGLREWEAAVPPTATSAPANSSAGGA
ncbi:hypothetical protein B0H19DRAFT_920025 [Mycena capillaripes]|nr:hypothetical protein B0H19DRAFT_920025 [Mycena capillaripes]